VNACGNGVGRANSGVTIGKANVWFPIEVRKPCAVTDFGTISEAQDCTRESVYE